jgi:recombination protein RecA|tara:strand:+ start:339 stop:1442 length:1104 start_codon:yes stop_codon:yes gene_type:complete
MSVKDDLANVIADNLNKKFKDNKVAYFLDGSDDTPTDIKDFISTGSSMLDLAISNREDGGIAVGRITEINGLESSGKSLLASHILAETQKKGGIAVYMDTETSVSRDFLEAIGVDVSKLLYLHFECVEDIFEAIEDIITKVRESDKDRLVTILVDSLAATSTKVEIEADFEKDGYATTKAIVISKALRKITQMIGRQRVALVFTNQLRQKLGVMFGDPWTTSGGKALPFHASTRVRLKNMGQIKDSKKKNILGMKCRAQIIKNRLGPPLRHADYDMYFDSGIDNYGGWLNVMKEHKLVKSGGSWYTLEYRKKEYKFQSKDFKELMENNDGLRNHLYKQICEKCILEYQKGKVGIDDIEYTGEVIGDE